VRCRGAGVRRRDGAQARAGPRVTGARRALADTRRACTPSMQSCATAAGAKRCRPRPRRRAATPLYGPASPAVLPLLSAGALLAGCSHGRCLGLRPPPLLPAGTVAPAAPSLGGACPACRAVPSEGAATMPERERERERERARVCVCVCVRERERERERERDAFVALPFARLPKTIISLFPACH
jgi:hypothetical protein